MQKQSGTRRRFVESPLGWIAGILLGLTWVASMAMVTSNTYTAAPYALALVGVVLLWGVGLTIGWKMVKLRVLSWAALGCGAYYLWRCHMGDSVVEAWRESVLILGCAVFYVAGIYAGQGCKCRGVLLALCLALLLHIAALACQNEGGGLPWPPRPMVGVNGKDMAFTALFTYKNFAGFFLLTAGLLPLCRAVCLPKSRWMDWLGVLVGLAAVAASFTVGTRAVLPLLPVALVLIWLLRLAVSLAENRSLGVAFVLIGIGMFTAGGIVLYDFLFGYTVVEFISKIDTHLRYTIWELVCRMAPNAPLCGFGPLATQWEIAPYFYDWNTPNMAHNEYLQMWMDYGVIGLVLMVSVLVLHLLAGMFQLVAEPVEPERRAKVAMALLFVVCAACYAICDFGWHQVSLAAATAFACGILASPYPMRIPKWRELGRNWAPDSKPKPKPVCAQGALGRVLLILLAAAVGGDLVEQCRHTLPAWLASWRYHDLVKRNAPMAERRALLESVVGVYPDTRLMDHYVTLPMERNVDLTRIEGMLKKTLAANPRQLFTVVMLVDVLGRQGKFAEAEMLMRRTYKGDGPDTCNLTTWPFYYAYNLMRWGQKTMFEGDLPTALSMLDYAFNVAGHNASLPGTAWRTGDKPWEKGSTEKQRKTVFNIARLDMMTLKTMGIEPNAAWQQPMEEGGKPALYRRYQPKR